MLKLYYGIDKYLQVGYLNPNNPFVQLDGNDSNNSWKDRNYDANLHTVLFTLPTEVKSLAEFYQSTTSEKMRTSTLNLPVKLWGVCTSNFSLSAITPLK